MCRRPAVGNVISNSKSKIRSGCMIAVISSKTPVHLGRVDDVDVLTQRLSQKSVSSCRS